MSDRSRELARRRPVGARRCSPGQPCIVVVAIVFPLFFRLRSTAFMDDCILALAYIVMALGLNIVVGFAGLLDLGYVAFYAFGAYTMGWFGVRPLRRRQRRKGIHVGVSEFAERLPGIHLNFLLILLSARSSSAPSRAC